MVNHPLSVGKLFLTNVTGNLVVLNDMNESFVYSHSVLGGKKLATISALDVLDLDMRHLDVIVQAVAIDKNFLAIVTFRCWLVLAMINLGMLPLGNDCVESLLTTITLVLLGIRILKITHLRKRFI